MKGQDKTTRSFVVGPITAYVEKKLVYSMISNKTGPFLRVRGKGDFAKLPRQNGRITPACAGKRWSSGRKSAAKGDHPRVCGEKKDVAATILSKAGSPPRVRGKDTVCHALPSRERITPACAGKSHGGRDNICRDEDHPRVCGEKVPPSTSVNPALGSPPRVRGKAQERSGMADGDRITPACAGKSG